MITKSFNAWLDKNQYAWYPEYEDAKAIAQFIRKHTDRGTRIGKVLTKMKLDCDAFTIQQGVIAWNAAQYVPQIEIVSDRATIQEAYTDVYSCMTRNAELMAEFLSHSLLMEQGVRMAIYRQHGRITGRCLVDIHNKGMLSIYSNGNLLEFHSGLEELGYMEVHGDIRVLSNKKLPLTEFIPYLDEFGNHCEFARGPNAEWCFAFPDGYNNREEMLAKLVARMDICQIQLDVETLYICTDTELGQWYPLVDVVEDLNTDTESES
jgi:hypothetical protein